MRTSSVSSVGQAAFLDELEKIAEELTKKEQVKRYLKGALLISAGAGAGTGAVMLADKALSRAAPAWNSLSPTVKKLIVGPALGITTVGALVAAQKLREEQIKRHRQMDEVLTKDLGHIAGNTQWTSDKRSPPKTKEQNETLNRVFGKGP